jgi:hypothetical protein
MHNSKYSLFDDDSKKMAMNDTKKITITTATFALIAIGALLFLAAAVAAIRMSQTAEAAANLNTSKSQQNIFVFSSCTGTSSCSSTNTVSQSSTTTQRNSPGGDIGGGTEG